MMETCTPLRRMQNTQHLSSQLSMQVSSTTQGQEAAVAMDLELDGEVQYDFFPFIRQYKSGRVVRFGATDTVPAGTDDTGVTSKDVVINPSSGLWARLNLPAGERRDKLPVVVYYHGGGFVVGSTANRPTHEYLNRLAADANVLIVSPEYRLAPEHPLPTAHDDSWEALRWVASHATTTTAPELPADPWLVEHGDLARVSLAGVSAGGNIAHHVAERAGAGAQSPGVPIRALLLVHPFFTTGGREATTEADTARKAKLEAFWRYVCPGTPGLDDDQLGNPFSDGSAAAARVAAERVLVCVAEEDALRDRGVWYYERLKGSGYGGEVELHESMGEGHVFHYANPGCDEARLLHARVLRFLRSVRDECA